MDAAICAFCLMLSNLPEHVSMEEAPAVTVINGHATCRRHVRFATRGRDWELLLLNAHEWEMEQARESARRRRWAVQ
jgi:hypothetical protein